MDNSLPVVAALAAVVAVVATVVAWRAGRRARRAADLVAQLLDPPVLEPVAIDATVPALAAQMSEPTPIDAAPELDAAPAAALSETMPDIAVPPLPARNDRRPGASGAGEGNDPAQTRIPVLDLDRLRSWLTLGDLNFGRLAIVSVEIDNLAFVEERLGYAAGGHLIEAITQRLRTVTRPRDVVAHVNRERFVLVCREVPDRQAAEGLAERIAMGVAHPSVMVAGVAEVTASIGVALAGHLDERPESVLRRAIKAGNQAKALGGARDRDQRRTGVDIVRRRRARRRDRARRAAPALPADRELRDGSCGRIRSAGALGAPGARAAPSG